MKRQPLACVLRLALASASTVSVAQQPLERWYLGLSLGQSSIRIDNDVVAVPGATASTVTKDDTRTGYKLYGGLRVHRNLAFEAAVDFGKFDARRTVSAPPSVAGTSNFNWQVGGWAFDAVGILPFQRFSVFGKLGVLYSTAKTLRTATGAVPLAPDLASARKSEFNPHWGVGASYDFTRSLGLRAEYEAAHRVGNENTGEGNVDLASIGLVVKF
jgi:opacity protein-like surface antigen